MDITLRNCEDWNVAAAVLGAAQNQEMGVGDQAKFIKEGFVYLVRATKKGYTIEKRGEAKQVAAPISLD